MGTFGGGDGDDWCFRGSTGGGVIGCTFTLHSFEFLFGEIRAGKLRVFVHCERLRTMIPFFFYPKKKIIQCSKCDIFNY